MTQLRQAHYPAKKPGFSFLNGNAPSVYLLEGGPTTELGGSVGSVKMPKVPVSVAGPIFLPSGSEC